ncbi:DUF4387 domain-containing protein [Alteribacillus iranensis]|uniref:DUF4387 domain-containing protein n=1 Tax=Alteribacillus iranensis TaxID=930128 RepID=A0A1I2BVI8_9BACI|nr:DUF4387 domain-containing protein [Alteribacillus iranensis]SFE60091.1 protein of unknown function [Alteribacillus iranensis]
MTTLNDVAKTIRSKNAGTDRITFDIIFQNKTDYEEVKSSGSITKSTLAELYGISEGEITDFVEYAPANAIKFTIRRPRPSGDPGDGDIFGSQQYAPLLGVEIK